MTEYVYNRIFLLSSPVVCISLFNSVSLFIYHCNNSCRLRHKKSVVSKEYYLYNKICKQNQTRQHNTKQYSLHPSCRFMCETGTVMKDCKGMLITQNCKNVQMVMAMAFFERNHVNESALRYKHISLFYCNTTTVE